MSNLEANAGMSPESSTQSPVAGGGAGAHAQQTGIASADQRATSEVALGGGDTSVAGAQRELWEELDCRLVDLRLGDAQLGALLAYGRTRCKRTLSGSFGGESARQNLEPFDCQLRSGGVWSRDDLRLRHSGLCGEAMRDEQGERCGECGWTHAHVPVLPVEAASVRSPKTRRETQRIAVLSSTPSVRE